MTKRMPRRESQKDPAVRPSAPTSTDQVYKIRLLREALEQMVGHPLEALTLSYADNGSPRLRAKFAVTRLDAYSPAPPRSGRSRSPGRPPSSAGSRTEGSPPPTPAVGPSGSSTSSSSPPRRRSTRTTLEGGLPGLGAGTAGAVEVAAGEEAPGSVTENPTRSLSWRRPGSGQTRLRRWFKESGSSAADACSGTPRSLGDPLSV